MHKRAQELIDRTAEFARAILELCDAVPQTDKGRMIARQLMDAAASVKANYRAACRARSRREFAAKVGLCAEEADECCGWLELLVSSRLLKPECASPLASEAQELTAIFTASHKTASTARKN